MLDIPLYKKVEQHIRGNIENGNWVPGDLIPSESLRRNIKALMAFAMSELEEGPIRIFGGAQKLDVHFVQQAETVMLGWIDVMIRTIDRFEEEKNAPVVD